MVWFSKEKDSNANAYIKTYGDVVAQAFKVGGMPLVLVTLSILSALALVLIKTGDLVQAALPYSVALAIAFLVSGLGIYIYETSHKRKLLLRALDRFDDLTKIVLSRYLESKECIDAETVEYAIRLVNQITHNDRQNIQDSFENSNKSLAKKLQ